MTPSDSNRGPLGASESTRGAPASGWAVQESPRPHRIVVADDDKVTRDMLADILRRAGHLVELVEDGQEAVERVARGGIDLVLLDVGMPRLSGLEACRLLKGMSPDSFIPVVLITVKTDTHSRVEGLKIGADEYVCKPLEEQELLARVNAMLRIKALHDQVAAQRAHLDRLSSHDERTGLYNYRYLHTRLTDEFKRAERYHEPFACILADIDQLQALNEAGGRGLGDAAIQRVAEGLRRSVREVDVVARYGGDEFLVVLPSTHFAGAVIVAERIWREVSERTVEHEGQYHRFSVSIGVALYPSREVRTKDALLRAVETALNEAKRDGGNRLCVYQQSGAWATPSLPPPSSTGTLRRAYDARLVVTDEEPGPPPSTRRGDPWPAFTGRKAT
ncbi:GGDEF domain-containing protein [Chondromyces apiculatus]|uniref:diguanylate cyclase n=1 Tax=Chondromyces apiculatus DSM 436 TaxID=1192034 RepID=A0A017T6Y2_9BACT|nr:diguanylate cyclase [Chondromyces apiculatus]EYF04351.1 GGDEF/response regulator receiver domain protein [Chondromyces apiculatus DSM 436]